MMSKCRKPFAAAFLAAGVAVAVLPAAEARAQDEPPQSETPPTDETPPAETPKTPTLPVPLPGQETQDQKPAKPSERDEAISEMPTWEAYGAPGPVSLEETLYRLSRDFASTSELSARRLGAVPIWPRGEAKFGPVHLLPFVREAMEYETNFWRDSREAPRHGDEIQDAFTHVNEAGLTADMLFAGGRAKITSTLDSTWNVRYDDDLPDTWESNAQLEGSYNFPSGLWTSAGLGYERRDDPGDYVDAKTRFARTEEKGFVNLGWSRDVFFGTHARYEFGVSTTRTRSEDPAFERIDRDETTWFGKLSYPVYRDTTRIFGLYQYRQDQRNDQRFSDGNHGSFSVGMEGSIPIATGESRGIRGSVSLGFDSALYGNTDTDTLAKDSDTNSRDNHLTVNASLQYIFSSKTTADLRYVRTTQFSFSGRYEVVDRVDFTFSHDFTRTITGRLSAYAEHSDPAGGDQPPINTEGIGLGFRYAFNEWMDIDASFDVENRNWTSESSYRNYRATLGATFYLNALTPRSRTPAPH